VLFSAAFATLLKVCQQHEQSGGFLSILQVFTINLLVLDRILAVKFQVRDGNMKKRIWETGGGRGSRGAAQRCCAAVGTGGYKRPWVPITGLRQHWVLLSVPGVRQTDAACSSENWCKSQTIIYSLCN